MLARNVIQTQSKQKDLSMCLETTQQRPELRSSKSVPKSIKAVSWERNPHNEVVVGVPCFFRLLCLSCGGTGLSAWTRHDRAPRQGPVCQVPPTETVRIYIDMSLHDMLKPKMPKLHEKLMHHKQATTSESQVNETVEAIQQLFQKVQQVC